MTRNRKGCGYQNEIDLIYRQILDAQRRAITPIFTSKLDDKNGSKKKEEAVSIVILKWGDYDNIFILFSISIGSFYWSWGISRKTIIEIKHIWIDAWRHSK